MRYREGGSPDAVNAAATATDALLLFTAVLALFIGVVLFYLGRRGRVMWLSAWSLGLMLCSVLYIANGWLGFI